MFCPQCGQERLSNETTFCSRCGFLLTGTAELLLTDGLINRNLPAKNPKSSARTRGLKQGFFLLLTSILIVPVLTLIAIAANMRSPVLPLAALIILITGGCLRMAYAILFESQESDSPAEGLPILTSEHRTTPGLPQQQTYPASNYAPPQPGSWRTTTNGLSPHSVTEPTTKLLEKEAQDQ